MATIAELIVKLSGDNTGLREALLQSAQQTQKFAQSAAGSMEMAGAAAKQQAVDYTQLTARAMDFARAGASVEQVAQMTGVTMRQAAEAVKLYSNTIAKAEIDLGGLRAAQAQLSMVGMLPGIERVTDATRRMTMMQMEAIAMNAKMDQSVKRTSASLLNASGSWTTLGRRGATAMMGLGFGIESLVSGSEQGMRRALRSVESFAIFFGPEGLLVAAMITGGLAIYDHFHKIEKAIDDTLKRAVSAASQAANAMDMIGLQKALRDIQQGAATTVDPSHPDQLLINKRSQYAQNAFEGSGADLEAHIAQVNDQIAAATRRGNIALVGKLTTEINALEKQIEPIRTRYNQIKDLILNPAPQMTFVEARKPIDIKGESPETRAAEATKKYYESLSILITRLDAAKTSGQSYYALLQQLLDAYSKLGGIGAVISGAALPGEKLEDTQKRLAMIKELHKVLTEIGPKVSIEVTGFDLDKSMLASLVKGLGTPAATGPMGEQLKGFDNLIAQIEIYRNNIELTNMDLQAHGQRIIDIEQALGPLREQAVAMATELRKALRAAGLDPAIVDLIVQHWLDGLKKIGAGGADTASKLQRIADVMQQVSEAANAAASINDALRGNRNTSAVISSVGSAAGSIGAAAAAGGTNVAADLQALSDVINVGNALTASAREIALEHKEILKQNNERLAEVSMRLVGFAVSAGTSVQAQQALQALFANSSALSQLASGATHTSGFLGTGSTGDLQTQINALMPFLQSVGLTFEQFKKIAADNGFDILDKNGRLVTDALQQMRDRLQDVIRSLFTFQNTLGDQKSLAELEAKLSGGLDTPQAQVNRDLALIQKLAPHLLPAGASAQGGENQDALRKMLQDLLQRIAAGGVSAADFGGFQNLQELVSIIDATAGSLNELRNVTNGVTAALTSVPTGFKLALLEFDMQDAVARNIATLTPPDTVHPGSSGGITMNIEAGAISIDPTNKNAAEIGAETLEGLKALAGQKLNNRARWADM